MTTETNNDFYVFLPKTDFPMRGELAKKEPEILAAWEQMDLYKKIRESPISVWVFIALSASLQPPIYVLYSLNHQFI